jgi:hypothetical protein
MVSITNHLCHFKRLDSRIRLTTYIYNWHLVCCTPGPRAAGSTILRSRMRLAELGRSASVRMSGSSLRSTCVTHLCSTPAPCRTV